MTKLDEIIATGTPPGFNTKVISERDVDRAAPRALKSLNTTDENKLIKESGFSKNHIKRTWGLLLLGALFITCELTAQDINPGYVFTPTDRVTATKLNNLVNLGTINPTFISGKAASTPQAADNFLFYRAGVLYRTPFSSMGINNTNLITDQIEDTTPAVGDYLLTFDVSAGTYKKTQLNSLVMTNNALINSRTVLALPTDETFYILGQESTTGDFFKINRTNYFYNLFNIVQWTNLARFAVGDVSAVTFPVRDSVTGTNYQSSLDGLISLTPVYTTNDPSSYVLIFTNGHPARMTMQSLSNSIVQGSKPVKFTSTDTAVPAGGNNVINTAHGLGATPQLVRVVLVCQTAENNYAIGDEAAVEAVSSTAFGGTVWNWGANTTNVWVSYSTPANSMFNKTTAAAAAWTTGNWKVRIYAVYFP